MKIVVSRCVLLMLLAAVVTSCSDDEDVVKPPAKGTVTVAPQPDGIDAPWQLAGPGGIDEAGSGRAEFKEMPAGTYTVTWHDVSEWETPDGSTRTLASGGTVTFAGAYVEQDFVHIIPGTFQMGSPEDEPGRSSNETRHEVTLTKGFYMSKYEVTEEWWEAVMGSGGSTSRLPKNFVSWDMAVAFCNALSLERGLTPAYDIGAGSGDVAWDRSANGYRLPTEAEWEYACRSGTESAYHNNTNCLSSDTEANFRGGSNQLDGCPTGVDRETPTPVGLFQANAWGLYDMHGNVWEWVWDGYRGDYQNLDSVDPVHDGGPGDYRVFRGGSWSHSARHCRSAYRLDSPPATENIVYGFRPARSAF